MASLPSSRNSSRHSSSKQSSSKLSGSQASFQPQLPSPSILIVDDERRHAHSVAELLGLHEFHCDIETSSSQALERIASGGFDLVLLDLNMPELSGIDVLSTLRERRVDVAVIVLSGERDVSNVTPILRLGADDFLHKPFEPEQLINSVSNSLTRRRLITENATLAAEREETNRLHEFMVRASPDVIYMLDSDGNFQFLNKPLPSGLALESDLEQTRGQHWSEVITPELANRIRWRFNERRTGERATANYEIDIVGDDDEPQVVDFSAVGLYEQTGDQDRQYSGTYGVVRDVTRARLLDRQLAQSQEKFYGLFMDSPDAIFIAELDTGDLLEGNDNFRKLAAEMGIDTLTSDAFIWADAVDRAHFVEGLRQSPAFFEGHIEREVDTGTLVYNVTARILQLDGRDCMLASLRDRTEQERARADRRAMESRLQEANKMEALGNLAGGIAHDFNNILASIIGYAELILESRDLLDTVQVDSYLSEVVVASKRARDLIAQMLQFTRTSRKAAEPVDVGVVIDDVFRMLRAAIPSTITIRTRLDDSLPAVLIDTMQFQQVLMNLLINASDAIDGTGSISIEARSGQQVRTCAACGERLSSEHCVLSVTDTGHGIPDNLLPRIFERYMTTRDPGESSGTGMGLWLIQSLVHDNGGHITVRSSVGEGTEFRIHLPFASSETSADRASSNAPATTIGHEPKEPIGGQVVVVDDEVSVSGFISEVLRSKGFDVAVFNDARAAHEHIERNIGDIELLITDQRMPALTGIELAERARALRAELPVILISGFSDLERLRAARAMGIDRILAKPFHISELLDAVKELAAVASNSEP